MCPVKVDLVSVTFDPETAEICLIIVTHPSAVITLRCNHQSCDMYSCIVNSELAQKFTGILLKELLKSPGNLFG